MQKQHLQNYQLLRYCAKVKQLLLNSGATILVNEKDQDDIKIAQISKNTHKTVLHLFLRHRVQKVMVKTEEGHEWIYPHKIIYCKKLGRDAIIYGLNDQTIEVKRTTLEYLEEQCKPTCSFYRLHSYLLNLSYVKKLINNEFGHTIIMENEGEIKLSRNKVKDLKVCLEQLHHRKIWLCEIAIWF